MNRIAYFFASLIRNYPTSKELTKLIQTELDSPKSKITILDDYHALVGSICVWTENFPYAYGNVSILGLARSKELCRYNRALSSAFGNQLPDRATVYRLYKSIQTLKETWKAEQLAKAGELLKELND
jgi:hypothetical protein